MRQHVRNSPEWRNHPNLMSAGRPLYGENGIMEAGSRKGSSSTSLLQSMVVVIVDPYAPLLMQRSSHRSLLHVASTLGRKQSYPTGTESGLAVQDLLRREQRLPSTK
jgi:hypothetical protein